MIILHQPKANIPAKINEHPCKNKWQRALSRDASRVAKRMSYSSAEGVGTSGVEHGYSASAQAKHPHKKKKQKAFSRGPSGPAKRM